MPTSAEQGTLPDDEGFTYLIQSTAKENNSCRILFNNEYYYICDNNHTNGTLVFSHVGYESDNFILKTITITVAFRTWVLTSRPMNKMAIIRFTDQNDTQNVFYMGPMPTCGDPQQDIAIFLNNMAYNNNYLNVGCKYYSSSSYGGINIVTGFTCNSYGQAKVQMIHFSSGEPQYYEDSITCFVQYKIFDWNNINEYDDYWI